MSLVGDAKAVNRFSTVEVVLTVGQPILILDGFIELRRMCVNLQYLLSLEMRLFSVSYDMASLESLQMAVCGK